MEPVQWARQELRKLLGGPRSAAAARQFLREQTGPKSAFVQQAESVPPNHAQADKVAAVALASWIEYSEAGMAAAVPEAVRFRVEAATDLMEQVERLLADGKVHPAAPVMLAGAALEEFLRGLVARFSEGVVKGRPSINSYAQALQAVDAITRQDGKELLALAGERNDAAHGKFENITMERARLMVDRVNFFMARNQPESAAATAAPE